MTVKFAKARQNLGDFMNISLLNLEQIELPDEIIDISLRSKTLTPWNTTTQNLFSNLGNSQSLCAHEGHGNGNGNGKRTGTGTGTGIDAEKELLIDELTARLGEGTCQHIYPADEHTPEQAFAISVNHANPQHKEKTNLDCAKRKRPLWLFDTPRPVVREQLQLLHGPERIQTAWWTEGQNMTCRDYYIAKHKMGMECWAFLDSDQQWYLHGYFG